MKLRADKAKRKMFLRIVKSYLSFYQKPSFWKALLSLFSGHCLLSGPVVVFFSDLALLSVFKQSFQSCWCVAINGIEVEIPVGCLWHISLVSQLMPASFLDEEDESKALFTLTTISRLYSFTFLLKKQKQKTIFSLFTGALVSSGAKTKLSLKGMLELVDCEMGHRKC